jgi:hypothetical protein
MTTTADLVDATSDALSELVAVELGRVDGGELIELLMQLDIVANRVSAFACDVLGEMMAQGIAAQEGYLAEADLLSQLLRLTRPEARKRIVAANRFAGRRSMTGAVLEPLLPCAAEALAEGAISPQHATLIGDAVDSLPECQRASCRADVDEQLTAYARDVDPRTLRVLADRVIAHLDPDGPPPNDRVLQRRRGARLVRRGDGSADLTAVLTPAATAVWETILHALDDQPRPVADAWANPDAGAENGGLDAGSASGPDVEAGIGATLPDDRTQAERCHDALQEAGRRLLATGDLPATAGLPATLVITMTLSQLEARAGQATTHHGGALSIREALRLAADGKALPVVLDQELATVAFGRGRRLASRGQRLAEFARDIGCTFPGCRRTAAQSQIQHMIDWAEQEGPTDVDNLTITCGFHNNQAPKQGWSAVLVRGIVHWIPPALIDPARTAQRNYIHRD